MDDRSTKISIGGREFELILTTRATKEIAGRYGGLENLGEKLVRSHGKDYVCGENGNVLSGGEKQRISIARALLRKTSVLLMDEATAALDEITANETMSSILSIEDLTSIVVTHRLDENVLKQYDGIIVLHNGKVEECDTFEKLLERKGYF